MLMKIRRTLQEFINESNIIYDSKFSYDKAKYKNNYTKLIITCPIHGDFEQTPLQHLRGNGCVKCSKETNRLQRINTFIMKATNFHENKYMYDVSNYIDNRTPIQITCPIHGVFKQTPSNHLKGHNCKKCQYDALANTFKKPIKLFVEECNTLHNFKYDYSKVTYNTVNDKITIICPIHGEFTQLASHHLRGCQCPKCSNYGYNASKPGLLYYLSINNGECYKIGVTNLSVTERYSNKELEIIDIIEEIWYQDGQDALEKEQAILQTYQSYKYTDSAPLKAGNTELFNTDIRNVNETKVNSIREL